MPGFITHKKIFDDTLNLISSSKRKRSFIHGSLQSLMSSQEYRSAALFGTMGPNIFDYIPFRKKYNYAGSPLSFHIHDGNSAALINEFISIIHSYEDKQTHWASMQRAYLYGFISHIIADTIIHPLSFYWSGFPKTNLKKEITYYRHQNLLYYYNMDNYFLYKDDDKDKLSFNQEEMIPLEKKGIIKKISPSIKSLILMGIDNAYPELYSSLILKKKKTENEVNEHYKSSISYMDLIPVFYRIIHKLKKTQNERIKSTLDKLASKPLTYSDFFVRYPHQRNINDHVLNLHMEKWQFPDGNPQLKYESVKKLMIQTIHLTLDIWEVIEKSIYSNSIPDLNEYFSSNALTGSNASYHDMKLSQPYKLNNF